MSYFNDHMVENPMILDLANYRQVRRYIDHAKIADYNKAIDLLDDAATVIAFPHAEVFRAEIHKIQEGMIEVVRRLEATK